MGPRTIGAGLTSLAVPLVLLAGFSAPVRGESRQTPRNQETSQHLCSSSAGSAQTRWYASYADGWREAERSGKMMLVWFQDDTERSLHDEVGQAFRCDKSVQAHLEDFVLVKLPVDAEITSQGKQIRLLEHAAFAEMHGRGGLAIIDLVDSTAETFKHVVSAFPFMKGKYYRFHVEYLPVILGLPRGTITQRTMIWAVRVHPEHPASTEGEESETLVAEACSHSHYQARIRLQGHHQWENRFHRIRRLLGGRTLPVEVVAESWPDETMIDSCIDCVASWRQSSGHWHAVSQHHSVYGYDIHRGANGIWYGTGIFASYE